VIDNSGSIRDNDPPGGNNWQLIIDFVKSIIGVLTVTHDGIRVALVDFGITFSRFTEQVISELRGVTCHGITQCYTVVQSAGTLYQTT